jgi:hypothetical protein
VSPAGNRIVDLAMGMGPSVDFWATSSGAGTGLPALFLDLVQQNLQAVCKGVSRSSDRLAAYATAARI